MAALPQAFDPTAGAPGGATGRSAQSLPVMLDPCSVARALGGKARGNSVSFPTPGHSEADRGSSLTIDPNAPDGFVVHAHNGFDDLALKDHVRQVLGMPAWSPSAPATGNGTIATSFRAPQPTIEYIYRNAEGNPSRKVKRTGKSFPQSTWTGAAWKSGATGTPILPYRLPELIASGDAPVFICEGEKDADRLAAEGFTSTTNPMGAGCWNPELNHWFAGRECFVLEDNDKAGRDHAHAVAKQLQSVARSVCVVRLPGLPERGDVSDWLDADAGNKDRLLSTARAAGASALKWPGILTSAEFLEGFTSPDHLVDGILNRRFIYSLTGATGSGKTAIALDLAAANAQQKPFAGREVSGGRVLYLAGENPTDVQMRWDAMSKERGFDPRSIDVHFVPGVFNIEALMATVRAWAEKLGGVSLVIVDTSAAYFLGDEENSNTQLGGHARTLRTLTALPGGPCVVVNCHPVKNASNDNLIPRGGGAFIAEVDGNFACARDDNVIRLHWQGKFRGPDFDPLSFELVSVPCPTLCDSKGRELKTVIARALSVGDEQKRAETTRSDEDMLLLTMRDNPGVSMAVLVTELRWPNKSKVSRTMARLKRDRFVEMKRGHWQLTRHGKAEAKKAETPA